MNKLFGRTFASVLLIAAALLTAAIAIFLIAVTLVGPKPIIEAIACEMNLSHQCLRNDLRKEQQKLQGEKRKLELERRKRLQEERQRAALEKRIAELRQVEEKAKKLQAVHNRLKEIGHAASSFVIFHRRENGRFTIESGHRYASLLRPNQLVEGWCNLYPPSRDNLNQFLLIARFDKNKDLKAIAIPRSTRKAGGLTKSDIETARKHCIWPKGVS